MAQNISMSFPGCPEKCGDVTIPYPFGIGPECSLNSNFTIICGNTSSPLLTSINRTVLNISVHGVVIVDQPVSPMGCSADQQKTESLPMSLEGSPFTISSRYNSMAVLGCTNSVWLLANDTTVGGCMAICQTQQTNTSTNSTCGGLNCCKAAIPPGLQSFQYSYRSIQSIIDGNNTCGYTFPVYKKWFQHDYGTYIGLQSNQTYPYDQAFVSAPLVLEWELDSPIWLNNIGRCKDADIYRSYSTYSDEYSDPSTSLLNSYYEGYEYVSLTKFCYCKSGYEGNPYVDNGCVDIDECAPNYDRVDCTGGACFTERGNRYCGINGKCINNIGGYTLNFQITAIRLE